MAGKQAEGERSCFLLSKNVLGHEYTSCISEAYFYEGYANEFYFTP